MNQLSAAAQDVLRRMRENPAPWCLNSKAAQELERHGLVVRSGASCCKEHNDPMYVLKENVLAAGFVEGALEP